MKPPDLREPDLPDLPLDREIPPLLELDEREGREKPPPDRDEEPQEEGRPLELLPERGNPKPEPQSEVPELQLCDP